MDFDSCSLNVAHSQCFQKCDIMKYSVAEMKNTVIFLSLTVIAEFRISQNTEIDKNILHIIMSLSFFLPIWISSGSCVYSQRHTIQM